MLAPERAAGAGQDRLAVGTEDLRVRVVLREARCSVTVTSGISRSSTARSAAQRTSVP